MDFWRLEFKIQGNITLFHNIKKAFRANKYSVIIILQACSKKYAVTEQTGGLHMNEGHIYIAIDLKSFYASVECVERQKGKAVRSHPAGKGNQPGTKKQSPQETICRLVISRAGTGRTSGTGAFLYHSPSKNGLLHGIQLYHIPDLFKIYRAGGHSRLFH